MSFRLERKPLSNPPTCLFVEHKKAIVLTLVALAAIGALVIGALAMSGVGSISQLGLPGGGAIAGLGFFVLLVIVGYCAYKRCGSQSNVDRVKIRKRTRKDESNDRAYQRRDRYSESSSLSGEKAPTRSHYASKSSKSRKFDYRQAELRDLFVEDGGVEFDRLPIHSESFWAGDTQAPIMKGKGADCFGEFVCIKLRCVSPKEEMIAKLDPKNDNNDSREGWLSYNNPNHGTLTLFKVKMTPDTRVWVQSTASFFVDPTFLKPYKHPTEEEPSDRMLTKEQIEKDRQGFALLQQLLRDGEVTDCQGLRWEIVR